jgi:hypothetical protein
MGGRLIYKNKLFLNIWIFGMFGVIAVNVLVVPDLIQNEELPFSNEIAVLVSTIQSSILLALAAWGGSNLSNKIDLKAPALSAYINSKSVRLELKRQIKPGLVGGIVGALMLIFANLLLPTQLNNSESIQVIPLIVKILYGGITEEILLRWGVMSFLVWIFWWLFQKKIGNPKASIVLVAIFLSSILFALGHIPAATLIAGESLTMTSLAYVLTFNSLFGIVAGLLFWRYGLEAAIIAHLGAHLFSHYFFV